MIWVVGFFLILTKEHNMLKELQNPNLEEAFNNIDFNVTPALMVENVLTNRFSIEDISKIVWNAEGERGGLPYLLLGELNDGRWFFLNSNQCWSDWDDSVEVLVSNTFDNILRFGPSPSELHRLCGTESLQEAKALTNL